jgi:hypothetical protein
VIKSFLSDETVCGVLSDHEAIQPLSSFPLNFPPSSFKPSGTSKTKKPPKSFKTSSRHIKINSSTSPIIPPFTQISIKRHQKPSSSRCFPLSLPLLFSSTIKNLFLFTRMKQKRASNDISFFDYSINRIEMEQGRITASEIQALGETHKICQRWKCDRNVNKHKAFFPSFGCS